MRLPMKMKQSVFRRLLTYFLCVGLLPVVLLVGFAVVYANTTSMAGIRTNLAGSADHASVLLETELKKYQDSVEQFCIDDELLSFLYRPELNANQTTKLNQKLYLILAGRADLLSLYIADKNGDILLSTINPPEELLQADPEWGMLRAMRYADHVIFYSDTMTIEGRGKEPCIAVGSRVMQDGEILGYVFLSIPQSAIRIIIGNAASDLSIKYLVMDMHDYLILNQVFEQRSVFVPWEHRQLLRDGDGDIARGKIFGEQVAISTKLLEGTGIRLAGVAPVTLTARSNASLTTVSILLVIVWAAFCAWISRRLSWGIVEPIQEICSTMELIEQGDLDRRVDIEREDEFAMMASGLNHMVEQLEAQFSANLERQNRLRLAELKNLQAQISPHFLYNTLESIKWLARLKMNDEIETIVEKLGVLLKSGMNFKRDMIELGEELNVVESYLAIQRIRYEGRLTASIDVEAELLGSLVPNLVIQPLVENAVVHCVEQKRGAINVRVRGWRQGDLLTVSVEDNGNGISQKRLDEVFRSGTPEDSIGLANVHRRLRLYFGNQYGLQIESKVGEGTTVYARMPFKPKQGEENV
ncbi:sensor histidine kinase [Eubacteriales bacterium OttesenSCG-928-K08]|nr:sensor histidine kinase [Eubacteriales bacterium OttesenSCG-928-K08]